MSKRLLSFLHGSVFLASFTLALPCMAAGAATDPGTGHEANKKIFGHYMGSLPAGYGAMSYHQKHYAEQLRHDSSNLELALGGRFKQWPLAPTEMTLTPEQSADLEIRRALRSGLDGFAIDAWAGQDQAKRTFDALFTAAEAGDYPFEITICIDPSCVPPGGYEGYLSAIRYVLEKHGDSPKLARRDGKPLIFGYTSRGLLAHNPSTFPLDREDNWTALIDAYSRLRKDIGQPLYLHFGMEHFFVGSDLRKLSLTPEQANLKIGALLGREFEAVGLFLDYDHLPWLEKLSQAVRAGGAEWAPPISIQYDNPLGSLHAPVGTSHLREGWERARHHSATLIQFGTWNDYGEHTSLAPTTGTGYGFGDINRYFADWWKTGVEPKPSKQDRVYATYRKHPPGAKTFPFQQRRASPGGLEIITILPSPATIRLPGRVDQGRPIEYAAPAGFSVRNFPLTAGLVRVEVIRDGKVQTLLDAPEAVTDRPFREDNVLVCASTEDERLWKEEFPDVPWPRHSEYRDDDGDGLPNWFESYWFGSPGDTASTTSVSTDADPDGDGQTNLQEYLAQTDPTHKPATYAPGYVWDIREINRRGISFNPDRDTQGTPVWYYLQAPSESANEFTPMTENSIARMAHRSSGASIQWQPERTPEARLTFRARKATDTALAWESPIDATISLAWHVAAVETRDGITLTVRHSATAQPLWSQSLQNGEQPKGGISSLRVKAGERIYIQQSAAPGQDTNEAVPLDQFTVTLLSAGK